MKKLAFFLLLATPAFAVREEWNGLESSVLVTKKYFIFRECGRYLITKRAGQIVCLFTGRDTEEGCLPRGETVCSISKQDRQVNLDCGDFKRTYLKK